MSGFIAALPMYDWPEARAEIDAEWARIRDRLRRAGIAAPARLVRRNADMPAVPGGIGGADGGPVAPDPATLPPDGLDFPTLWRHPDLLLAQTCWGPMEASGLAREVSIVCQPSYDAVPGGKGEDYSSAIVMRRGPGTAAGQGRDLAPPADGGPAIPLDRLSGLRLAYNAADSMSGMIALRRDLEAAGQGLALFSSLIETGAHRASIRAVAAGTADLAAIDCRSWQLAGRFEPAAAELVVAGWTARRKGLPYIAARTLSEGILAELRAALRDPG